MLALMHKMHSGENRKIGRENFKSGYLLRGMNVSICILFTLFSTHALRPTAGSM
jgi:hypothetical protein